MSFPMFLIDSHAHLSGDKLCHDAPVLIQRAFKAGVRAIVDICTDQTSLEKSLELKKKFPDSFFIALATTPHDAGSTPHPLKEEIYKLAKRSEIVAIGETGLDFTIPNYNKEAQIHLLEMYGSIAKELHLPLIFHCRGAFDALFEVGKTLLRDVPCVVHCFTGTKSEAKKALDLGWYLSISGIITFPKSIELQEIIPYIPLDRMFIETDSPYLAPVPHRGKTCEPAYVAETAKVIAHLRKCSPEEVALVTAKNEIDFFKLPIAIEI
jgi:TatD DNase family protein